MRGCGRRHRDGSDFARDCSARWGTISGVTDEQAWAEFRARREQVQTHPGMVARRRWDSLQRVHKVLIANQNDLLEFISAFETNEKLALAVVQSPNQTGADDVFFDELFRRM